MQVADFLQHPTRLTELTATQWDALIPEARQAGLLPRLAEWLRSSEGLASVPDRARPHLLSALVLAEKHRRDVLFEIDRLVEALRGVVAPIILLKGAAYLAADLPPGRGRVFSDIDILISRERLGAVEAVLNLAGWRQGEITDYDQQYYRRWMHQIPPLVHFARQSALDVHHSIVPLTARVTLSSEDLLKSVVELGGSPGLATLAPPDMVLHSAVHLFNEGEFRRGLRDLSDLDLLLRHFGSGTPGFWSALVTRAEKLDLRRPLFYALRHAERLLGTPVPSEVAGWASAEAPPQPLLGVIDLLFDRALTMRCSGPHGAVTAGALWLLYARSHYLKMPLHILLPHLARKAIAPKTEYGSTETI